MIKLNKSLGLDAENYIFLKCWAKTHEPGICLGVRDGTPGYLKVGPIKELIEKENIEYLIKNCTKGVVFPFSIMRGESPRMYFGVPNDKVGLILDDSLKPINWFNTLEDYEMNDFSNLNMESLIETVKEKDVVSLIINEVSPGVDILKDFNGLFNDLKNRYNLNYSMFVNLRNSDKINNLLLRISFFNINMCVPVFGKNDGILVHAIVGNDGNKTLSYDYNFETVFIFTNSLEGLETVEGDPVIYGFNEKASEKFFNALKKTVDIRKIFSKIRQKTEEVVCAEL